MKREEITRLESVNPTSNGTPPLPGLFQSIMAEARPASASVSSRSSLKSRAWRVGVAIVAMFAIGSGVSWAATGEFPRGWLFGHELGEGLSAGQQDSTSQGFSVLHSADENAVSNLPKTTLFMLQGLRAKPIPPPAGGIPDDLEAQIELDPASITAVGETQTDPSGGVSVVAIDGQICSFWIELRLGNCGSPAEIESRGRISVGPFAPGGTRTVVGLVDDRVAAIRIEGSDIPDQSVTDNVFEVTNLPKGPLTIVALDDGDNELFRRTMP